ncbi:MAG TPA: hypothetical protein VI318_20400 [Baekduia sp.]
MRDADARRKPTTATRPAATVPATVPATAVAPLSTQTRSRSKAACRRFAVDVRPYAVGAGLDDLARSAHAYRMARERLAKGLLAVSTGPDRGRVANYVNLLRAGNQLLLTAEQAARAGDIKRAYAAARRWNDGLAHESRLVRQLRLRTCPK